MPSSRAVPRIGGEVNSFFSSVNVSHASLHSKVAFFRVRSCNGLAILAKPGTKVLSYDASPQNVPTSCIFVNLGQSAMAAVLSGSHLIPSWLTWRVCFQVLMAYRPLVSHSDAPCICGSFDRLLVTNGRSLSCFIARLPISFLIFRFTRTVIHWAQLN